MTLIFASLRESSLKLMRMSFSFFMSAAFCEICLPVFCLPTSET
jgi:hypothetical protein